MAVRSGARLKTLPENPQSHSPDKSVKLTPSRRFRQGPRRTRDGGRLHHMSIL
jgi:hypothetical protein